MIGYKIYASDREEAEEKADDLGLKYSHIIPNSEGNEFLFLKDDNELWGWINGQ